MLHANRLGIRIAGTITCNGHPRIHHPRRTDEDRMRPTQDFTASNLLWMRTRGSLWKTPKATYPKDKDEWLSLAQNTESAIATGEFSFRDFRKLTVSQKVVVTTRDLATLLTLRKVNDNVRRAYGIRQTSRQHAIRLAKTVLAEAVSKGVIRLDLKSCFENIRTPQLLHKLRLDAKVSQQTLALTEQMFRTARHVTSRKLGDGLPRGLLTSSTFAEVMLRPLDVALNEIPGVYLVIRYVDDILLFTTTDPEPLMPLVRATVSKSGFVINETKFEPKISGCKCALGCTHMHGQCTCEHGEKCSCDDSAGNFEDIEFLGYRLVFKTGKDCGATPCYAVLSDRKCARLKARIALAAKSHIAHADIDLLTDRIRVLTGNCVLRKTNHGGRLLSGLATSHAEYDEPPAAYGRSNRLSDLDNFLQGMLRRTSSKTKTAIPPALRKLSFSSGFHNRRSVAITPQRMRAVRSCWNNV